MPEIPLNDPSAGLNELDRLTVLAIMRRPFDADIARKTLIAAKVEALAEACPYDYHIQLPVRDLALLARSEPSAELLCSAGKRKGCFGGWVAGEFLLLILNLAEKAPQYASVNQTAHVLVDDLYGRQLRSGKKAPCSRSVLLSEWSKFKSAAHLWAAFNILSKGNGPETRIPSPTLQTIDLRLLAIAKELARRATTFKPRGGQASVLDAAELWSVPSALSLPPIELHAPPVTPWASEKLRQYPAELRRTKERDV
jgi:hypothetical protein